MTDQGSSLQLVRPGSLPVQARPAGPAAVASDDILDHVPALRAFARGLCRGKQDPDDLVQETLLRAIEYASSYRAGTNLRAWLFTIMRSRFYNTCRKSNREGPGQADCVSTTPRSEPTQEWHLRRKEMISALDGLPQHYREALMLIAVLGESYISAAQIMDCDIGTVKSRVCRARRILRTILEPEF